MIRYQESRSGRTVLAPAFRFRSEKFTVWQKDRKTFCQAGAKLRNVKLLVAKYRVWMPEYNDNIRSKIDNIYMSFTDSLTSAGMIVSYQTWNDRLPELVRPLVGVRAWRQSPVNSGLRD